MKPLLPQFMKTLYTLNKTGLAREVTLRALCSACRGTGDSKKIVKNLSLLSALVVLDREALRNAYQNTEEKPNIDTLFFMVLSSRLSLPDIPREELMTRYAATFGSLRRTGAFETYIASLASVPGRKKDLEKFLSDVLCNRYEEERFRTDNNPHLQRIQELDPALFEKWKSYTKEIPFEAQGSDRKVPEDRIEFFREKLSHGHWMRDGEDKLPRLTRFLQTGERGETPKDPDPFEKLETLFLRFLQDGSNLSLEETDSLTREIIALAENERLEIGNDMKVFLSSPSSSLGGRLSVKFVNDYENLLLRGTEVQGSCQRIDGNGHLNQGLLGQLEDGKNSDLIVWNGEKQSIMARRGVRILIDKEEEKPCIFVSRLYANDSSVDSGMIRLVKIMREDFGCKVFLNQPTPDTRQESHTLIALASSAPVEYVDEAIETRMPEHGNFSVGGYELL